MYPEGELVDWIKVSFSIVYFLNEKLLNAVNISKPKVKKKKKNQEPRKLNKAQQSTLSETKFWQISGWGFDSFVWKEKRPDSEKSSEVLIAWVRGWYIKAHALAYIYMYIYSFVYVYIL